MVVDVVVIVVEDVVFVVNQRNLHLKFSKMVYHRANINPKKCSFKGKKCLFFLTNFKVLTTVTNNFDTDFCRGQYPEDTLLQTLVCSLLSAVTTHTLQWGSDTQ